MERYSFCIVLGESPKTMQKLCLFTQFTHQELRSKLRSFSQWKKFGLESISYRASRLRENNPVETKNNPEEARNNPEKARNNPEKAKNNLEEARNNPEEAKNNPEEVKNNPDEARNNPEEAKNNPEEAKK